MKPNDVIASIPRREADTHKGTYGKALLVAGSEGMTGAAILASRGAYRAGAGLVTVGIDRSLFCAVSPAVPEAIFLDTGPGRSALGREVLNAYQAVLLGPGIGTTRSLDFAWWVLENRQGPLSSMPMGSTLQPWTRSTTSPSGGTASGPPTRASSSV